MSKKNKLKQKKIKSGYGEIGFWAYYTSLFSSKKDFNRWKASLMAPHKPILRIVPGAEKTLKKLWKEAGLPWKTLDWYKQALVWPEDVSIKTALPGKDEFLFYPMNPSSLLPVLALDPKPGEKVLDACAAPGGKTLMIAEALKGKGELLAIDQSPARIHRLREVIKNYNHPEVLVSLKDSLEMFRSNQGIFDKILVDAPCSSEKHVAKSAMQMALWSPNRPKQLHTRQVSLLCGLSMCLKPGGRMVYATCATTPLENEAVVSKFLKKREGKMRLVPISEVLKDKPTGPGMKKFLDEGINPDDITRIWPRDHKGMDPMFIAVFEAGA